MTELSDDLKRQNSTLFSKPQKGFSRAWYWDIDTKDKHVQKDREDYLAKETLIWQLLNGIIERAYDRVSSTLDNQDEIAVDSMAYKLGYRAALRDIYRIVPKDIER